MICGGSDLEPVLRACKNRGRVAGFPEPVDTDECRKASPVAVWHSSSFHPEG